MDSLKQAIKNKNISNAKPNIEKPKTFIRNNKKNIGCLCLIFWEVIVIKHILQQPSTILIIIGLNFVLDIIFPSKISRYGFGLTGIGLISVGWVYMKDPPKLEKLQIPMKSRHFVSNTLGAFLFIMGIILMLTCPIF